MLVELRSSNEARRAPVLKLLEELPFDDAEVYAVQTQPGRWFWLSAEDADASKRRTTNSIANERTAE